MKARHSRQNWQKYKIQNSYSFQEEAFATINCINYVERQGKTLITDTGKSLTEFVSCAYLGLDQDERLTEAAGKELSTLGFAFNSARTRVVPKLHTVLEEHLQAIFFDHYLSLIHI